MIHEVQPEVVSLFKTYFEKRSIGHLFVNFQQICHSYCRVPFLFVTLALTSGPTFDVVIAEGNGI